MERTPPPEVLTHDVNVNASFLLLNGAFVDGANLAALRPLGAYGMGIAHPAIWSFVLQRG